MSVLRAILAFLLAGTMFVACAALIFLLFYTWTIGQWWWTALVVIVLGAWFWFAEWPKGEKRNDYGV